MKERGGEKSVWEGWGYCFAGKIDFHTSRRKKRGDGEQPSFGDIWFYHCLLLHSFNSFPKSKYIIYIQIDIFLQIYNFYYIFFNNIMNINKI